MKSAAQASQEECGTGISQEVMKSAAQVLQEVMKSAARYHKKL